MRKKSIRLFAVNPLYQGDLDGLCGIYAIINSVRILCPEANRTFCSDLFRVLVGALQRRVRRPVAIVWRGLKPRTMLALMDCCTSHVRKRLGTKLMTRRLSKASRKSLAKAWREIEKNVKKHRIAILGIDGVYSHWTVVHAVTPKTIRLCDSAGPRYLRRSASPLLLTASAFKWTPEASCLSSGKSKGVGAVQPLSR